MTQVVEETRRKFEINKLENMQEQVRSLIMPNISMLMHHL